MPKVTFDIDNKDDASTIVRVNGKKVGNVRERYTPKKTFDAYRNGRHIYMGADTFERAVQALVDFSTINTEEAE